MSQQANKKKSVEQVAKDLGRYSLHAFEFLHHGLDYTVRRMHGPPEEGLENLLEWLQSRSTDLSFEDLRRLVEEGEVPPVIVELIHKLGGFEAVSSGVNRHVGGEDLCWGLRDLALRRWGLMASLVLRMWGIRGTEDFGRMVFALVESGLLQKQPGDSIADFTNVFDFAQAFDDTFKITLGSDQDDDPDDEPVPE